MHPIKSASDSNKHRPRQPRRVLPYMQWTGQLKTACGAQSVIYVDVSPGGLGLHVARPPAIGAEVDITIDLPGGETGHGRGTVVHVTGEFKPKIGCTFVQLDKTLSHAVHQALL